MAIGIFSNIGAMFSQRSLNRSENSLQTAAQRLSSGKRINSAKDDASGLAIAQRMTSYAQGLQSAARNANDGISLVQTANSAVQSVTDNLQRMRELSIQAANGTLTDSDRGHIQSEINALKQEVSSVIDRTSFNGVKVLKESGSVEFQVGASSSESDTISMNLVDLENEMSDAGFTSIDVSSQQGAEDAIATIDSAIDKLSEQAAEYGAIESRFESTLNTLSSSYINTESSRSRIEDADYAKEITNMMQDKIKQQASIFMLGQANASKSLVSKLLGG